MTVVLVTAFMGTFLAGAATGVWLTVTADDDFEDYDPDTLSDWNADPFEEV